jgi:hypothetical protein
MPTRSYLSQSELAITVGLGISGKVDALEVLWPSGTRQKIPPPPLERLTVLTEPK